MNWLWLPASATSPQSRRIRPDRATQELFNFGNASAVQLTLIDRCLSDRGANWVWHPDELGLAELVCRNRNVQGAPAPTNAFQWEFSLAIKHGCTSLVTDIGGPTYVQPTNRNAPHNTPAFRIYDWDACAAAASFGIPRKSGRR
jgi:hypothetical protein